jgi:tol-pal system protein YbgF
MWGVGLAMAFAVLASSACAHQDMAEKSLEDLRAELTRVAADRDRLEERVVALETAEQKRSQADAERPAPIAAPADPAAPRTPNARPTADARSDADRTAKAAGDPKRDFDAGTALLRAKQYDKALDAFTAFLVRYPDHEYADQAMFLRGESFYGKGTHGRAAEQFQGLLARFPLSNRAPDALLRLGLCQRRLGAEEQAQHTFAELQQRYPKSDAARQVPHP